MSVAVHEPAAAATDLLRLVEQRSGQNVFSCYQCGKCTAGCPFGLEPQRTVRLLQLGAVEEAMASKSARECASCFTCETACPNGVSPALLHRTLRSLAEEGHAPPHRARSWMFTHIDSVWRLANATAPLGNWALHMPGAGVLAEATVGVHRKRALPPLASPTFPQWFARRASGAEALHGDGHRGRIVLFHDTFMDYNYPGIGIALTELLERAGFRVELADMLCCGRPMLSKAQLLPAAERARENVRRLHAQVEDGAWIVGTEPSCLFSLREEYPDLVGAAQRAQAKAVARQVRLADELLGGLQADGELELEFRQPPSPPRQVLFHAHCHHKHSGAPQASLELLQAAGYDAEMLDTACCGMAGSYGFEKEHYEASRRAGERALFPLLRQKPAAEVAITGMSCRQQIEHFTGRRTRHVVELLREAAV